MQLLILVRHSQPEIDENIPAREWNLSAEGRTRAERLADRLKQYQPECVISSVEPKARETAEIIAGRHGLSFHVVEGLHEHDRSNVQYLDKTDFQTAVQEFFGRPDELVFGSETADEAHERFQRALQSALTRFLDKTLAVVSHGTVMALFVSRLVGVSAMSLWNEFGLPSFVVLDMQSNSIIAKDNVT